MTETVIPSPLQYRRHLDSAADSLEKRLLLAGIEVPPPEIIPTDLERGYRSRVKFKIYHRRGNVRIMGTDPRSGDAPVKDMQWILPVWVRPVVEKASRILEKSAGSVPVHGLEIQLAHGREEVHITLAVKRGSIGAYAELAELLINDIDGIVGVAAPSLKLVRGRNHLNHRLGEMDVRSDHRTFFQSNIQLTPFWLDQVRSWARSTEAKRVVDIYCGAGLLAFSAARKTTPILGVEKHLPAVCDARDNARRLGFREVRFIRAAAGDFNARGMIRSEDLVLLDPPRTGCPPTLISALIERRPRDVISISCCPGTHQRDLRLWMQAGYRIESICAYDAYPFTPFLETLVYLKPSDRCQSR